MNGTINNGVFIDNNMTNVTINNGTFFGGSITNGNIKYGTLNNVDLKNVNISDQVIIINGTRTNVNIIKNSTIIPPKPKPSNTSNSDI